MLALLPRMFMLCSLKCHLLSLLSEQLNLNADKSSQSTASCLPYSGAQVLKDDMLDLDKRRPAIQGCSFSNKEPEDDGNSRAADQCLHCICGQCKHWYARRPYVINFIGFAAGGGL